MYCIVDVCAEWCRKREAYAPYIDRAIGQFSVGLTISFY